MSVTFIGMISTRHQSEIHPPQGPAIDADYLRRFARAHEEAGFDRILIPYHSTDADTLLVAAYAAAQTERIGFMLAHRPGFVAPTLAARKFATLDQLTGGRIAIHVISGGDDAEQQRDGDFLDHDARYRRTDEYVEILKRVWTGDAPFDHEGEHYRFKGAFSEVKPVRKPHIPIYFGGSSEAAIEVAGRHADIYALWGETREQVRETIAKVRAAARRHGRDPDAIGFSLSLRPVLAASEAAAWERAQRILATVQAVRGRAPLGPRTRTPQAVGSQRLLAAAAQGRVVDKRLWTEIAAITGARGNTTALVGTPEQVAESLLEYHDLGVTTFLIRGFDPYDDAVEYGRRLLPLVRQEIARRDAAARPVRAAG
ncbi:MAG TPA: LLM class flavin-dependent oxidoreductase [Stellaceae bacterium]|nr:LLM class flavin-dependent oxidoreductase [Stellaceae bacterium]